MKCGFWFHGSHAVFVRKVPTGCWIFMKPCKQGIISKIMTKSISFHAKGGEGRPILSTVDKLQWIDAFKYQKMKGNQLPWFMMLFYYWKLDKHLRVLTGRVYGKAYIEPYHRITLPLTPREGYMFFHNNDSSVSTRRLMMQESGHGI